MLAFKPFFIDIPKHFIAFSVVICQFLPRIYLKFPPSYLLQDGRKPIHFVSRDEDEAPNKEHPFRSKTVERNLCQHLFGHPCIFET